MQTVEWTIWAKTVFFLSLLLFANGFLFFNVFSVFAGTSLLVFLLFAKYSFQQDCGTIKVKRKILETNLYVNHPCHIKTEIQHLGGSVLLSVTEGIPSAALLTMGEQHKQMITKPEESLILSYQLTFHARGLQKFQPLMVQMNDLMNLFTIEQKIYLETPVLVHSDPEDIRKAKKHAANFNEESFVLPSFIGLETSIEYEGIREFLPGDLLRSIDWKASSRLQNLVSRIFEKKETQKTLIVLDVSRSMRRRTGKQAKLDHAIGITLQLTSMIQRLHQPVGFIAYDEHRTIATVTPTFDYQQIYTACSHLPVSIATSSYQPHIPKDFNNRIQQEPSDHQQFLSTVSPFLSGRNTIVKNRLQTTGIYQAAVPFLSSASPTRLVFITDLETESDVLLSTLRLIRARHHTVWLLTVLSPLYDDELKKNLTVDDIERLYKLQFAREKILYELKKQHIEVVDLTPTMQGLQVVQSIMKRR
ncbi:MAG: DUF58 domain-containing protein [Candidatus Thermoplasmatota archaeon]|nr:DUF58 domain-containing protein [Candidatus Thermoplasmatota archaeon]